jgi:hypothetical protein
VNPEEKFCKNCGFLVAPKAKHCQHCGQSTRVGNLSVFVMAKELFENIFNVDSRFINTFKNIWRPSYLAKEYILGKRKKYLLPIQNFLFVSFVLFFLVLFFKDFNKVNQFSGAEIVAKTEALDKYNDLAPCLLPDTLKLDSLRKHIFESVLKSDQRIFPEMDMFGNLKKYKISYEDVYSKDIDTILSQKKVTNKLDQILLGQLIKFEFNPVGVTKFLVSMITWAVLFNIILIAFVSTFLYYRRKMYYVEHLTFGICLHTTIFYLLIILVIIDSLQLSEAAKDDFGPIIPLIIVALVPISYMKFYSPGFWKNLIKLGVLFFLYFISFAVSLFLILGINFLFFI